jgi:hypothetical protein
MKAMILTRAKKTEVVQSPDRPRISVSIAKKKKTYFIDEC